MELNIYIGEGGLHPSPNDGQFRPLIFSKELREDTYDFAQDIAQLVDIVQRDRMDEEWNDDTHSDMIVEVLDDQEDRVFWDYFPLIQSEWCPYADHNTYLELENSVNRR